jgi:hypothetical protein
MASHDTSPQLVTGIYEVSDVFLGRGLVDSIKDSFPSGRKRRGDFNMNRSRNLLQQHLQKLPLSDQHFIREKFDEAREAKAKLARCSRFQKLFKALEYEKISKYTFQIIEDASQRAIDNGLMAQISEAMGEGAGSTTTTRNPFTDSHAISTLTDIDVRNLDRVEMETYRSKATGEAAVVLDLHSRDASTHQVVATFSPEVIVGDEMHRVGDLASIYSGELYGPHSEAGDDARVDK